MKPSLGRIVLYLGTGGIPYAAIISQLLKESVELTVFWPDGPKVISDVKQGDQPGTWDWMPYQKAQVPAEPVREMPEQKSDEEQDFEAACKKAGYYFLTLNQLRDENIPVDFGLAIEALKEGYKVARSGWNGKGMWLVYQKGYPDGIPINKNTAEATGIPEGTTCRFLPYIMMKTAGDDVTFVPWLASQSDVLAEDWLIVK